MKRPIPRFGGMLLALAAAACSSTSQQQVQTAPQPQSTQTAQLEALYHARTDSAKMHFTKADVDFMTGMIAHHAQALIMCDMAPSHGASPAVATLCRRVLNAQRAEIITMQNWLRDRGQPVPEVVIHGLDLMLEGVAQHHVHMPGMLTQQQLVELDNARGAEWDRQFLTKMIGHHQGAVDMVHDLFATDGAAQDGLAFKLANDIQADQTTEINRMKLMLEALPAPDR